MNEKEMENRRVHEKDNERHDKMEHVAVTISDIDNVEQIHNMASVTNCAGECNLKHVHGTDDVENVSSKNSLEQVHEVVEKNKEEKNQDAQDPDSLKNLHEAPSVQNLHEAPSVQNLDEAPSVQNLDEAPSVQNLDEAPSVQNLDEAPIMKKLDEAPSVQNLDEAPIMKKLDEAPSVQNLDEAPIMKKLDEAPSVQNLDEAPIMKKLDEAPIMKKLDEAPIMKKLDEAPIMKKLDQAPIMKKLDEAPIMKKLDQAPIMKKLHEAPSVKKLHEAPIMKKLDEAPIMKKLDQAPSVQKLDEAPSVQNLDEAPSVNNFPRDNTRRSACETDIAKECAYNKNNVTNSHYEDFTEDIHEKVHLENFSETVNAEKGKDKNKQKSFQYESVIDSISDLPQTDQKNSLMENLRAKVSKRIQGKSNDSDKIINKFYRRSEEVLDNTYSGSVESAQGKSLLPTTRRRSSLSGSDQMSQVSHEDLCREFTGSNQFLKDLKIILDHAVSASGEISGKHEKIRGQQKAEHNQKHDTDECIQNCLKNLKGKGSGASEDVKKRGGDRENRGQGHLKLKTSQEECRSRRKEAPVKKIVRNQSNIVSPDGGRPGLRNRLHQRVNMKIILDDLSRVPPSEFFLPPEFAYYGFTATPDLPSSSSPPAEPNRVRPARSCVMQMASLNRNVERKVPWLKQELQSSKMSKAKLRTDFQAAMKQKSLKNAKSIIFESKTSVYNTRRTTAMSSEPRNTRSTQAEANSISVNKARPGSKTDDKYKHLSPSQRAHLQNLWAMRKKYRKSKKHSENGDKYKHLSPSQRAHLQNLWAMKKYRKRRKHRGNCQGLQKNQNENIQRNPNKKLKHNLNQGSKLRLVKNSTLKDIVSRIKQGQNLKRLREPSDNSDTVGESKLYKCEDLFKAQGTDSSAQNKFYGKICQREESNFVMLQRRSRKSRNHVTKSNSQQEVTYVQDSDSDNSDLDSESSNNTRVGSPEIELDVDEYSDSVDFEHVYSPEPFDTPRRHPSHQTLSVNVQPLQTPSLNVLPLQTPSVNVQPHRTPSVNVQPHRTPSLNVQPHQTPSVVNVQPHQTPSVVNVQPHQTPSVVNVQPHQTPSVVNIQPHQTPSVVNVQPHQTPSVNNQPRKLPIFQQKLPNPSPGPIAVLYYNPEAAMLYHCSEHHSCCQLNAANAAAKVTKVDSWTQWEDPLKLHSEILAQCTPNSRSFKTSVIKYATVAGESTNISNAVSQGNATSNLPSATLHQKVGQIKSNALTYVTMNSDLTSTQKNLQGGLAMISHDPASLSQGHPIVRPTNPHSSNSPSKSTNSESCLATTQPDFSLSSNMTALSTLPIASVSSGSHQNANVKAQSFNYGPFSIPHSHSQSLSIKSGQSHQRLDNAHFLIKDGHLWIRPLNRTGWNKVDKDKYALVIQTTNGTTFLMLKVIQGNQTSANVVLELPVLTASTG